MSAKVSIKDLLSDPENENGTVAKEIDDRLSQELIIALVGPVGSGVSTAASMIEYALSNKFEYAVAPIIKLSDIIRTEATRVGKIPPSRDQLDDYIEGMQEIGNELRHNYGNFYLTEKVIEKICKYRKENGGYRDADIQLPGRRAYIIDSLKNVEELTLLKRIYGDTLIVCGVFAPDKIRQGRLENDGVEKTRVESIVERDQQEVMTFGQMTRKIFQKSDFFVCNDQRKEEMERKVNRFLELIFDTAVHTPTRAESAMYEASAAASSSGCMSRQVGASIVSAEGELIAVGWNDVPKFGGGLYGEDDKVIHDADGVHDKDHRCHNWSRKICHNETRRLDILSDITKKIANANILRSGITAVDVRRILDGTAVDSLIEYSRSIHAEMEAILSVAREGKGSLVGATLYTNTYPCHNCARHIVASGIKSVMYIEPYKKSLATTLHADAITEDSTEKNKVIFRQYDGVSPNNFVKLFRPLADRKSGGKLARPNPKTAMPVFRMLLDAQSDYEFKIIADLTEKEQKVLGG